MVTKTTKRKPKSKPKSKSKSKRKPRPKSNLKSKNTNKSISVHVYTKMNNTENKSPFMFAFNSILKQLKNFDKTFDPRVAKLMFSPLSGSEPKYEPEKWNNNPNIKDTHNCYSYAINQIVSNRKGKPQPGYFAHFKSISNNEYKDCKSFFKRLKKDSPSIYLTTFDKKCRKGFSKAFIVLANKTYDTDYHFYRQDSNGYWSHKPGRTDVVNTDADNKLIKNPEKANRNYKHHNYATPCFYFCKSDKLSKTSSISK